MAVNKQPVTFLSLPGEIRNKIYEFSGCLAVYPCCHCKLAHPVDKAHYCTWPDKHTLHLPAPLRIYCQANPNNGVCCKGNVPEMYCSIKGVGMAQPALTKVSKQVRLETLSIFYGNPTFYFAITDPRKDHRIIMRWLRLIGPRSASYLRKLVIVYGRNQHGSYARNFISQDLEALGVKTEKAVQLVQMDLGHVCDLCIKGAVVNATRVKV